MISQHPPLPLQTPNPKPFRFHLKREQVVSKFLNPTLLKRNYKYIHGFETFADKKELKTIQKLTYLTSLHATSWGSPDLPFFKKLIKRFRKYLRNIQSSLQIPVLQKILPRLTELNVTLDHPSWRLLTTQFAFEKLTFNFDSQWNKPQQRNIQYLLLKFKTALSRNLPRMGCLQSLEIIATNQDLDEILPFLEILSEKISKESPPEFTLRLKSGFLKEDKPFNSRILHPITNLSIADAEKCPLLFLAEEFKNLSNLHLVILPAKEMKDLSQLTYMKNLPKIRKLTSSFTAYSFPNEEQFLRNFLLPPTLDFLDLQFDGSPWNESILTVESPKMTQERLQNNPLYVQFFNRLQSSGQNIKSLNLKMIQGIHSKNCIALTEKFAGLFIQQFPKLESLSYQNSIKKALVDILAHPLDLGDFWKALEPSREDLRSISIDTAVIILPEMVNSILEARFPRLESLNLKGKFIAHPELNLFCQSFSSLKKVQIQTVVFADEQKLDEFLLSWSEISQEMNVDLQLCVQNIRPKFLIDCLTRYVQEVKIKGKFKLSFIDVQVDEFKAFQGILSLAQEKGCFDTLSLTSAIGQLVFYLQGQNLVKAAKQLTS